MSLFILVVLFAFPSAVLARCGDQHTCRNIRTQQISAEDVARYAYAAGFRGRNLIIAVAVAGRESGGFRAQIECDNLDPARREPDGSALVCSTDFGLWQANNDPDNWFDACSFSREDVLNPVKAAEYAHCLTAGGARWHLYNAYRDGTWREYEAVARTAVKRLEAERARVAMQTRAFARRLEVERANVSLQARTLNPPFQPQPEAPARTSGALFSSTLAAGWLALGL